MQTALSCREHKALGLNRPRPQQSMPMGFACDAREGAGYGQELGAALGQSPVERWKAQIIADRQP